jgi:signal transduction histidine kinase
MIYYYWIIRKPQKNILRRMIAITIDISAVTLCIYFLEWASLIVYPVYLWIIVGNGMRFGSAYLYTAMVLAIIGFGLLLLYHPFWSANYKMGYGLMGIIVVLPLFFLVMLKRLQWSNQQLREELALRKRQEAIMIEQSRHAAMGEMISNIAHQWRQPLKQITQMMSKTIDDFRNFFAPNKYKELFSVAQSIENAFTMIEASLKHHAIEVLMNLEKGLQCYGYPNEFSQVVLNLLVNAKDVLEEHSVKGATILISSYEQDGNAVVVVEDNGGGIQEEIIGKIFEPYFTTKEQGKGTGIGLYMSKLIIDEHMGGNLSVQNSDTGARFIITLDVMKKTGA